MVRESGSTVLCDDTNSVSGGLTETSALVTRELADGLDDSHIVFSREVVGAKVLNEVIEDEKTELHSLLDTASESSVESSCSEGLHDVGDHTCVGLEKSTAEFGSCELEVVLVVTFLFDNVKIFLI